MATIGQARPAPSRRREVLSSVKLRFSPDPPAAQVLDLQIFWHGGQLNLHLPSAYDSQESPTLDSSGLDRYTLLGSLAGAAPSSPQYYVRIEFRLLNVFPFSRHLV